MSNPEPTSKPSGGPSQQESADARFRYIGFEVFPKTSPRFWKSEQEEKEYLKRAGESSASVASLDREFSLLRVIPVSGADRIVITVTSILMIASVLMPWIHFRTDTGADFSLGWAGALGTLLGGIGTAFAGGIGVALSAILGLFVMIATPLVGLWSLAMLWKKTVNTEVYFLQLRRPLRIGYWIMLANLGVIVLSFFGGEIPGYETWGLIDPGEHYGIMTLASILSYGVYTSLAMSLIAGVKSADL